MVVDTKEAIEELFRILTELDARESSANSVISDFEGISWYGLCDNAIWLLKQIK